MASAESIWTCRRTGESLLAGNLVLSSRPGLERERKGKPGLVQDDIRAIYLNLHGSTCIRIGATVLTSQRCRSIQGYLSHSHVMQLQCQLLIALVVQNQTVLGTEVVRIVSIDDGKLALLETCGVNGQSE
jgi:hypothetical protein